MTYLNYYPNKIIPDDLGTGLHRQICLYLADPQTNNHVAERITDEELETRAGTTPVPEQANDICKMVEETLTKMKVQNA